jgi:hypothetical protein
VRKRPNTPIAKQGNTPEEVREFHTHEQSLTMLADNKQWLADNDDKLADNSDEIVNVPKPSVASEATLAAEEEHILRCLGAALIMLRIPTIATTHSDGSRPPVPIDRDQCGAGANGAIG